MLIYSLFIWVLFSDSTFLICKYKFESLYSNFKGRLRMLLDSSKNKNRSHTRAHARAQSSASRLLARAICTVHLHLDVRALSRKQPKKLKNW
jgi:hypothetical protein